MSKVTLDTENEQTGQGQTKEISGSGKAEVLNESEIEKVDGFQMQNLAELEQFMNEEVEVLVYEPFEEGQEQVVQLGVNGVNQFVVRGIPQTLKRKYVEVLARAKKQGVTARGYKAPDGEAKNDVRITTGLQYPFQILNDPNRNGPAWLRKILAEG